ncbi:MAG: ACP S-malonyltransferase [candidate division WOR-3 bacterium]
MYDQASDILQMDIRQLSFEGPEEELRKTFITQPAILVHSIAVWSVVKPLGLIPQAAAGHSLGEYSALYAAGALDFESVLKLVKRRGELMWNEGVSNPGTMAAIIGLDAEIVSAICREVEVIVVPANFNEPNQTAISGQIPAVEKAMELAKARGALKAVRLPVSGAFHSPLLENSVLEFSRYLSQFTIRNPSFPVIANATGLPESTADEVRANLDRQLTSPVQWVKTIQTLRDLGIKEFYELGPGKVLCGLAKRIDRNLSCKPIGSVQDINQLTSEA